MIRHFFALNFSLASLVLIIGLSSCNDAPQYPVEVNTLDTTIAALESAKEAYFAIDSAKFMEMATTMRSRVKFVQENYSTYLDTMPREIAFLMSNYRSMNKSFKRFSGKRIRLRTEIEASLTNMKQLRIDLNNNVVAMPDTSIGSQNATMVAEMDDSKRANYYLGEETRQAMSLIAQCNNLVTIVGKVKVGFEELNPKVEEIVLDIESKMDSE